MEKVIWSNDATAYDFEESRQTVSDVECIDIQDVDDDAVWRYINDDICLSLDAEEEFLESVKSGAATMDEINRFTAQLGPRVEAVYGWRREVK